VLTALGDQDVLIESNARINQKKRWPWMGKPGEVKWEEWMSILQPINRGVVEEKLKEKVPMVEPIDEKVAQDAIPVSSSASDRTAASGEATTDSSTDTSEAEAGVEPFVAAQDSHIAAKAAESKE
jgi:hypothetical protein